MIGAVPGVCGGAIPARCAGCADVYLRAAAQGSDDAVGVASESCGNRVVRRGSRPLSLPRAGGLDQDVAVAMSEQDRQARSGPLVGHGVRHVYLLGRMERRLRGAAGVLAAAGHGASAGVAEQFADSLRFDREQPAIAQNLHLLAGELKRIEGLGPVCEKALQAALSLVGADRGNIQVRHELTGPLIIAAQSGFDNAFLEYFAVTDDDASACGRAAIRRSQIVIADVDTDAGFAPHREIADASGFRGVCSTPLLDVRGNVVGALSTHYERPYRPSQRELAVLRRLGWLLGTTLPPATTGVNGPLNGYTQDMDRQLQPYVSVGEWRERFAAMAERTAGLADDLASYLEKAAQRGDEQRRLSIARTERQIAALQRRNASRLRQTENATLDLEHIPSLKL